MDVERSSLCNFVVNFLLEENYLLAAFELLHELLEHGRDDQAIRLQQFFSDPIKFPPDRISHFNSLRVADPQNLLEEKESLEEKFAVSEYELRLAKEDIVNLKAELLKKNKHNLEQSNGADVPTNDEAILQQKGNTRLSDLGPLKDSERLDINCAVKEYLLLAGYRLTAMTFYEEVTDQNLDVWQNSSACVPDALRHYYYHFLSSTSEAAQEKIAMLHENESLLKENDMLKSQTQTLLKSKEISDAQVMTLTKSLEALQQDIKEKENLVQHLKMTWESQEKELNDCREEITELKMHIEGALSGKDVLEVHNGEKIQSLQGTTSLKPEPAESIYIGGHQADPNASDELKVNDNASSEVGSLHNMVIAHTEITAKQESGDSISQSDKVPQEFLRSSGENGSIRESKNFCKHNGESSPETDQLTRKPDSLHTDKVGLGSIEILSNSLPRIVPYVLINHREELLPLIMCAIEHHPDSATRDSLTHTLFNLIKRPDEQQRRIIMDACVTLAKSIGQLRTETELLPQCWEQINHMHEERRLLVAQSCGELAEFVRPEIRDSLILSIMQQLIEDAAPVVREAAAHNLDLLLAFFPNTDKYFKVEEMMFQLVCDPSGVVVETTLKDLVPSLINWGNNLDHILQVLLTHVLGSAEHCPPLSGVGGSLESHLHVLGERERWNIDVLLRLLAELLPYIHKKTIETCPFSSVADSTEISFPISLLELYAGGLKEWPTFEWLHIECFPTLIQFSSLLPRKEDNLRIRISRFLMAVAEYFGEPYLTHIMLPVFLVAVGDDADLRFFPLEAQLKLRGLRPRSEMAQRLATMCVLPLLLAGILGHPSKCDYLKEYLRNLLIQRSEKDRLLLNDEIINSVRFICTNEENHIIIVNILWEMVVSSNIDLKITAANLLKVMVPYIDDKVASTHVLPALVTLGTDQNLNVKYACIDAFGAVAQHFKNDTIVEKIRIQMDAFLEDGSHEATIAVVRALLVAVPHTTDKLRDYLMSKILQFTALSFPSGNVIRRRERVNAFCEAIRALDATELSASSVRDYLLPAIQNLMKDNDALDPAHKEALEIIMNERSGGTFDAFSKVMGIGMGRGAHLGIASVTSFFGEGGLLGKKESGDLGGPPAEAVESPKPVPPPQAPVDDTRFMRIMRGGFTDMLRGRNEQ